MDGYTRGMCYRIEERTVIPGPRVAVRGVGGGFNGTTGEVEQNRCYVIVNGQTERYIGRGRHEVPSTSLLRPGDFFTSREEAELLARTYHLSRCPNARHCAWSE